NRRSRRCIRHRDRAGRSTPRRIRRRTPSRAQRSPSPGRSPPPILKSSDALLSPVDLFFGADFSVARSPVVDGENPAAFLRHGLAAQGSPAADKTGPRAAPAVVPPAGSIAPTRSHDSSRRAAAAFG